LAPSLHQSGERSPLLARGGASLDAGCSTWSRPRAAPEPRPRGRFCAPVSLPAPPQADTGIGQSCLFFLRGYRASPGRRAPFSVPKTEAGGAEGSLGARCRSVPARCWRGRMEDFRWGRAARGTMAAPAPYCRVQPSHAAPRAGSEEPDVPRQGGPRTGPSEASRRPTEDLPQGELRGSRPLFLG
jgi:hypothetical protein